MAPDSDPHKAPESKPAPSAGPKDDLKSLPLAEVEQQLGSSPDGLTQAEAEKRLTQYGPNEIAEHKPNPLLKFLTYFWGPIPWMIEAAVDPLGGRPALGRTSASSSCCSSPTPWWGSGKSTRRATPSTR